MGGNHVVPRHAAKGVASFHAPLLRPSLATVLFVALCSLPDVWTRRSTEIRMSTFSSRPPLWIGRSRRERVVPAFLICLGAAVSTPLLTGGSYLTSGTSRLADQFTRASWVILVVGIVVALATVRKEQFALQENRRYTAIRFAGLAIVLTQVLSSVFAHSLLSINAFLPMVLGLALVTRYPVRASEALRTVQIAVMIPVLASIFAVLAGFSYAETGEPRRLPGLFVDTRLTGVLSHPNALAPVAATAFVVSVARRGRWWWLAAAAAGWTLWATDTRTMILVAPLALAVIEFERRRVVPALRAALILCLSGVMLFALAASGSLTTVLGSGDIRGLNGRTQVWEQSVKLWQSSPFVGAGPQAFGEDFRARTGLTFAGQAHNQFFQSLAAEGILGVLALCVLVVLLGRAAARNVANTGGASLALFVLFLANLSTEAPLRASRWSSNLLVFVCLLAVSLAQTDPPDSHLGNAVKRGRNDLFHPSVAIGLHDTVSSPGASKHDQQ